MHPEMTIELSQLLESHFGRYTMSPIAGGATDARLFRIVSGEHQNYILKSQVSNLHNACLNQQWLYGKVPVPEIVFYTNLAECEWLCMQELKGHTLEYYIDKWDAKAIVRRYARSLQLLHSLPLDEQALVQNLDDRITSAQYNLENNLIDPAELEPENRHCKPEELFEKLLQLKPSDSEPVFTHGDYCFDNVIFDDDQLSGFIDLGNGGVADKYQDIALAVRSIHSEWNEDLVALFFETYGLKEINQRKLAFYQLLDEFF